MKKLDSKKLRIPFYAAFLLVGTWFLVNSCEEDVFSDENEDECMICWPVTYENGEKISEGESNEYCDEELEEILSDDPVSIGDRLTLWECEE